MFCRVFVSVEICSLLYATIFRTEDCTAECRQKEEKEDNMFIHLFKIRLYIMNPDESCKFSL